nr:putative pectate lyase precursor [Tanacetum cinerariifolium]
MGNVCQRTYAKEAEWKNWNWRSTGDVLENKAISEASESDPQLTGEQQAGMLLMNQDQRLRTLVVLLAFSHVHPDNNAN